MTNDSNENNRTVRVGTILIAANECRMDTDGRPTLTPGNEYPVKEVYRKTISIIDDEKDVHHFDLIDLHEYFKIKSDCEVISDPGDDFTITTNECESVIPIYENPTDKKTTAEELIDKAKDDIAKEYGYQLFKSETGGWTRFDKMFSEASHIAKVRLIREVSEYYHNLRLDSLRAKSSEGLPDDAEMNNDAKMLRAEFFKHIGYEGKLTDEVIEQFLKLSANGMKEKATTLLLAKEQQRKQEIQEKEREIERLRGELEETKGSEKILSTCVDRQKETIQKYRKSAEKEVDEFINYMMNDRRELPEYSSWETIRLDYFERFKKKKHQPLTKR